MNDDFDIVAILDQFQATLTNTSKILAGYYLELIDNGIPQKLAHELTVEMQRIIFNRAGGGSDDS